MYSSNVSTLTCEISSGTRWLLCTTAATTVTRGAGRVATRGGCRGFAAARKGGSLRIWWLWRRWAVGFGELLSTAQGVRATATVGWGMAGGSTRGAWRCWPREEATEALAVEFGLVRVEEDRGGRLGLVRGERRSCEGGTMGQAGQRTGAEVAAGLSDGKEVRVCRCRQPRRRLAGSQGEGSGGTVQCEVGGGFAVEAWSGWGRREGEGLSFGEMEERE